MDVSQVLIEAEGVKMDEVEDQNYVEKNVRVRPIIVKRERSPESRNGSRDNLSRDDSDFRDEPDGKYHYKIGAKV